MWRGPVMRRRTTWGSLFRLLFQGREPFQEARLAALQQRCAVAGAEPPLIVRADGREEMVAASYLAAGIDAAQWYTAAERRLAPGDLLLLTDGITEARRGGEFLGYAGLVEIARTHAWERAATPAPGGQTARAARLRQFGRAILDEAIEFAGGALHDDACLLLLEKTGQA